MLEQVFWDYFKNTGNINAFIACKDFEVNSHESTYNYNENKNEESQEYYKNEMT